MKMLWIKTQIHQYDDTKSFLEDFNVGEGDLIFTHEFIYKPNIYPHGVEADVLFFEEFGTGEPTNALMDKIFDKIKDKNYKRIIAIGGGSVIDVAKLMVFDTHNKALDMFEKTVPLVKQRELLILPTTCGTGSEVTNLSIAEIVEYKTKMGLASDEMYADHAILIPELIKSLPYKFFLYSSADALVHAVESYVSPKANEYTELFSVAAIKKIIKGYKVLNEHGEEARYSLLGNFMVASNYAGVAFGNAGVGAVHALSYPLGGSYHVPHGEANYRCFTEVFKLYDKKKPDGKIKKLKRIIGEILEVSGNEFETLDILLGELIGKKQLREYGMSEIEINEFAASVIKNQQRLLANNYVELSETEIRSIYKKLY